jgi:hypothetical protein
MAIQSRRFPGVAEDWKNKQLKQAALGFDFFSSIIFSLNQSDILIYRAKRTRSPPL